MLIIKKELNFYDFKNEYEYELKGLSNEGVEIIFNSLCEMFFEGGESSNISDYLRYQMQVSTGEEILNNYNVIPSEEAEKMTDEEKHEAIEEYLNDYTYLLGYYTDADGKTIYIYDEF